MLYDAKKKVNEKLETCKYLWDYDTILSFLNNIKSIDKLVEIIKAEQHKSDDILGWYGLTSLTCINESKEVCEIDIRYAWSHTIFKQNLVDHGWNESILLKNQARGMPCRHKIIIYLCDNLMMLHDREKTEQVKEHFLIGNYWQSIRHVYLQMPFEHPCEHQLDKCNHIDISRALLFSHAPLIINKEGSKIKTLPLLASHPDRRGEGGLRKQGLYKHSTKDKPLISIITVVFNGEKYIEQTIQSVINQSYQNVEYIIIDGNSTDKTLDIIKNYECEIDYWISEPDVNIYDAMNKGFACALGEFVNFMNVGDIFFNHKTIELLDFKNCINSLCGANIFFSNQVSGLIYVGMQKQSIPHQALFTKRHDFEEYIFNPLFKYCADAELWNRFNPINNSINTTTQIVSISRFGGISTSGKYLIPRMIEHWSFEDNKLKVLLRFVPKIIISFFLSNRIQEIIYFMLRRKIK